MAKKTASIPEDALVHIPEVEFTDTWRPIHHAEVVKVIGATIAQTRLVPVNKRYEVSTNGHNLFATWTFQPEGRDALSIGFRNSMQKDFSLGLVGGHQVMVCSNMAFWGDFVEHRRHTAGLTPDELHRFIGSAVESTIANAQQARLWYTELHDTPMPDELMKTLVYDALDLGIIPPSKFGQLQESFREELRANRHPQMLSLAHFHGAVTRLLRGSSVHHIQTRTLALNSLLQKHTPERQVIEAAFTVEA